MMSRGFLLSALVLLLAVLVVHAEVEDAVNNAEREGVLFYEDFEDGSRWAASDDEKFKEGQWEIKSTANEATAGDKCLIVKEPAKHHAISANFDTLLDPSKSDIVIQYEVRFNQDHQCGGAYLKVLAQDAEFSPKQFKDDTPYIIMFGPDKCGTTDKVHFIFRHKNPLTGEYEEKHLKNPPSIKNDRLTHVYTLIVRMDNTFEIVIDQKSEKTGSLLEDFDPPVNPPVSIDDPYDKKPKDWVDEPQMADPDVSKPDDWDEDEPLSILDESSVKPEGWQEDAELMIPDPEAERPEDWSDEDDGEWEAPLIDNPVCVNIGCGEWEQATMDNPKYKGKWYAPQIPNPDYKGEWKPRQIPNPDFWEDKEPHALTPMGAVGIEIWTIQDGIEFDNVLIATSEKSALLVSEDTWFPKNELEEKANAGPRTSMMDNIAASMNSAQEFAIANPIPFVAAGVFLLIAIFLVCTRSTKTPEKKQRKVETLADDCDNEEGEDESLLGKNQDDAEEEEGEEEGDEEEEQEAKGLTKRKARRAD